MQKRRPGKIALKEVVENKGPSSPVHFWDGEWWWWDEFKIAHGPFKTRKDAEEQSDAYWRKQ